MLQLETNISLSLVLYLPLSSPPSLSTELILRWLEGHSGSPGKSQEEGQENQGEVNDLGGDLLWQLFVAVVS